MIPAFDTEKGEEYPATENLFYKEAFSRGGSRARRGGAEQVQ